MPLPKIISPIFRVELPSTKELVAIRPMLVKEEKILLIAKESKETLDIYTAVKQVVNNCLIDFTNFDKLTSFDIEFLFLKIRALSISNKLKLSFQDSEDKKNYDFDINLDEVKMTEPTALNHFEFKNGDTTIQIILKFPSHKIYDDKSLLNAKSSVDIISILQKAVVDKVQVNGVPESYDDQSLIEWLDNLPTTASQHISEFISGLPHFHHEIKYTNSKGVERNITLSRLEDFFTLA